MLKMKLLKNTQKLDLGQTINSEIHQVNMFRNQPFQPIKI